MLRRLPYFIILLILFSCAKQQTMKELANIDSLAYVNPLEAMILLDDIDSTRLSSPEAKAYHILLSSRLQHEIYGINLNIDTINYSINYYIKSGDSTHAAESYHYKAAVLCFSGDTAKAVDNWKKAENILSNQHDSLRQEVLDRLFKVAFDRKDTINMRKYARAIQYEADRYHNRMWKANDRIIHARGLLYNAIIDDNDSSLTNAYKAADLINYESAHFLDHDYPADLINSEGFQIYRKLGLIGCRYLTNEFNKYSCAYLGDTIIGTFNKEQKLLVEKQIREDIKSEPTIIRYIIQSDKEEFARHKKEDVKSFPGLVNHIEQEEKRSLELQKKFYIRLEKAIKDSIRADSIIFTYISCKKALKLSNNIKKNIRRSFYGNIRQFRQPYDPQIEYLQKMFYSHFKDKSDFVHNIPILAQRPYSENTYISENEIKDFDMSTYYIFLITKLRLLSYENELLNKLSPNRVKINKLDSLDVPLMHMALLLNDNITEEMHPAIFTNAGGETFIIKDHLKDIRQQLEKWIDKSNNTRKYNNIKIGSNIEKSKIVWAKKQRNLWIVVAILLLTIVIGFYIYLLRRRNTMLQINNLTEQINLDMQSIHQLRDIENVNLIEKVDHLNKSIEKKTKELTKVKYELKSVQNLIRESQSTSRSLVTFSSILRNNNLSQITNEEIDEFLMSFSKIDEPYYKLINEKPLTPSNKFMLILFHLGKTEQEVCKILGLSTGAMRTRKSRIRSTTNVTLFEELL